jgi:TonB-dependent SusC/RagA subfamily outer membrane receptor
MENFLLYIGKSALAAGAFYLVYLVLFQNQKQFTFNRIYLPVSLTLSFVIPLISFTTVNYVEPIPVESNPLPVFTESFEPVIMQQTQPQFIWEWYHWLFAIYAAGTALFLLRLLLGHGKAWNIIRKSRVQELFNRLVNISKKDIHPFSFFSKIVLSENTLSHPNLEMIIAHESIHVKEKHTLDILFTEILFLLQWFNPFAWLLKDAVKNNLEYKTDHEIAKTTDAQTYQLAMVALADKQGVAPFLTALNGSQLKNRIVMMKKNAKNKYAWLKQLVVLPLLAVLVMGLSNREIKTEIKHLNESTPTHLETQEETTVYDQTTYSNNEHLEDKIISKKDQQIEPISDAKDNYKIQSDNEQETMILSENVHTTQEPDTNVSKKTDKRFSLDNRLYIIDGKEYKGDINDIDVNDIESISVLKDASATVFYGERGKNGVVLIKTKSGNKSSLYPDAGQIENSRANYPLIIIDGIITGYKSIDDIDPGDIRSVTILKDKKATERYGVKGKDGVIEITMKPVGIYSELQLRKFIAEEVRYPVLAHKSNLEKTVNLSVKIDTEGKISAITEESLTTDFTLDEVVVVGYKNQDTVATGYGSKSAAGEAQKVKEQLFADEIKRVISKISKLDSDKFKGKTVGITVKFILQ